MDKGAQGGYSPWGHKELETEQLTYFTYYLGRGEGGR